MVLQWRSLLLIALPLPVLAGPPLSIGDPGVLEPGAWEVIAAATATSLGDNDFYQAPVLDVSLGLVADRLQVSAVYPYVFFEPSTGGSQSDFGNLELGATWRLFQDDALQLALSPAYSFGVTRKLAQQGIGGGGDVLVLPVVLEYQLNERWRLNTSTGFESVEEGADAWSYGIAAAYALSQRWEVLLELVGAADTDWNNDVLDVRAGFDFTVTDNLHLLFAAGSGLREPGSEDQLDYDVYLGLQFML